MAVPTLPSNLASGDVLTEAWVDDSRALHAFWRDDKPMLSMAYNIASLSASTETEVDFSDGSGNFNNTPGINVDGWTAATSGNKGAIVPETGVYQVSGFCDFGSSTVGGRRVWMLDGGSTVFYARATVSGVASIGAVPTFTYLHFFTAGDELGMSVWQGSAGTLSANCAMQALWVASSTS